MIFMQAEGDTVGEKSLGNDSEETLRQDMQQHLQCESRHPEGPEELDRSGETELMLPTRIRKRDGTVVPFERDKIADAIYKAAPTVGAKTML